MIIPRLRAVPWRALRAELALPAIARVLEGAPAEREIDRTLRANRGLSREERTALVEAIFGVSLWRRRLAWHAGASDPRSLLEALVRELGGFAAGGRSAIARSIGDREEPPRLADRWSLPDWLEQHLKAELGEEAEAFCAAVSEPGPVCLRANRLLGTRVELAGRLREEGIQTRAAARAPDALIVETPRANLFGSRSWREGWFEPQDEGSQLVGELADGSEVLDLCAGAGGKSLQLAAKGSRVFAHDIDRQRLARLRTRAKRAHAGIEIVTAPCPAEVVLVDAPCSELGTLRRGPDLRWRLDPRALLTLPALQRDLLDTAYGLARKRIVYATCTLNRAENEAVAGSFEAAHPKLRRTGALKLFPHRDGTDGFFAVTWERS
jgi:16S rRNA (cytosine967-C5)-methyltransferase